MADHFHSQKKKEFSLLFTIHILFHPFPLNRLAMRRIFWPGKTLEELTHTKPGPGPRHTFVTFLEEDMKQFALHLQRCSYELYYKREYRIFGSCVSVQIASLLKSVIYVIYILGFLENSQTLFDCRAEQKINQKHFCEKYMNHYSATDTNISQCSNS